MLFVWGVVMCRKLKFLEKLSILFGQDVDTHDWKYTTRVHNNLLYYCRNCKCGASEVRMRDGRSWRGVHLPWRYSWEKEWFDKSVLYDDALSNIKVEQHIVRD